MYSRSDLDVLTSLRLHTNSLSLRWRRCKPAAACSYCSHIFLLFHAFSCSFMIFCFLMLLWNRLQNRDDWNVCRKTILGELRFFFSNRSIGSPPNIVEGHVLMSQFHQATNGRKGREKQKKAGKSRKEQPNAENQNLRAVAATRRVMIHYRK